MNQFLIVDDSPTMRKIIPRSSTRRIDPQWKHERVVCSGQLVCQLMNGRVAVEVSVNPRAPFLVVRLPAP